MRDIDIKVGQIVTPNINGFFNYSKCDCDECWNNYSQLVSLSIYRYCKTSKLHTVPYITVDQLPVRSITGHTLISGGSNDGEYVYMLFSQDPNTIDDTHLEMDDSPYVNQTIEIMSYSRRR